MSSSTTSIEVNSEISEKKAKAKQNLERRLAATVLVIPTVMTLAALVSLYWRPITLVDVSMFVVFYLLSSLGVTFGYHRLLTHNSFRCNRFLKNFFTITAAMSVQGPAIWWVAHHRRHHQFSDKDHDTHSPVTAGTSLKDKLSAFAHSHCGWMLLGEKTSARKYAGALMNDADVLKIDQLYFLWVLLSLALPAVFAVLLVGAIQLVVGLSTGLALSSISANFLSALPSAAFGGLMWGGFVRIFALHHATWSVNSVCHLFGSRPFQTTDRSANNAVVAAFTAGEGWHNGHHAFPNSARHGLLPGQFDLTWEVIRSFSKRGWVWAVKVPSEMEIKSHMVGAKELKAGMVGADLV